MFCGGSPVISSSKTTERYPFERKGPDSLDKLKAFALGGYERVAPVPVPKEPGIFDVYSTSDLALVGLRRGPEWTVFLAAKYHEPTSVSAKY